MGNWIKPKLFYYLSMTWNRIQYKLNILNSNSISVLYCGSIGVKMAKSWTQFFLRSETAIDKTTYIQISKSVEIWDDFNTFQYLNTVKERTLIILFQHYFQQNQIEISINIQCYENRWNNMQIKWCHKLCHISKTNWGRKVLVNFNIDFPTDPVY